MIIELKNRKEKFNFKMSGKYNIITGNSGTKKTYFLKTLAKYKRNVSSVFVLSLTILVIRLIKIKYLSWKMSLP